MGNVVLNGGTSGQITLQPTAIAGTNTLTLPAATGTVLTSSGDQTITGTMVMGSSFLRNKIINGAMVIDQRNAGASVTPTANAYTLDRWNYYCGGVASKASVQRNAGSVTPPTGFSNYIGLTSLSAYSVAATDRFGVQQAIEGFNTADLAWGTANAKTITLSFWVYSSLTGTFGGVIQNDAGTQYYVYSYTITAANTWQQKTITIPGSTTGVWRTDNGGGVFVGFSIGAGSTYLGTAGSWGSTLYFGPTGQTSIVGTNGATFYITGIQFEIGTVATPFEQRQYQQELALCQRYAYVIPKNTFMGTTGQCYGVNVAQGAIPLPVSMRSAPTLTAVSDFTGFNVYTSTATTSQMTVFAAAASATTELFFWNMNAGSVLTAGNATLIQKSPTNVPLIFSAEL